MLPETLNRIQIRAVGGQEEGHQLLLTERESGLRGQTVMNGSVVQDPDHRALVGVLLQEVVEKGDEAIAGLLGDRQGDDLIGDVVVGTDEMLPLRLTRGGHALLLASFHPTAVQDGVESERGFVHKEEVDLSGEGFFFKSSSHASAWVRASASCRFFRSCLGRR